MAAPTTHARRPPRRSARMPIGSDTAAAVSPATDSPAPICSGVSPSTRLKKTMLPVRNVPLPTASSADWKAIVRGTPGGGRSREGRHRPRSMPSIRPVRLRPVDGTAVSGGGRRGCADLLRLRPVLFQSGVAPLGEAVEGGAVDAARFSDAVAQEPGRGEGSPGAASGHRVEVVADVADQAPARAAHRAAHHAQLAGPADRGDLAAR